MNPAPISLFVDDACPLISLPLGDDDPLVIPNSFLDRFCEVVARWEMAGKFSVVPRPAGMGSVARGIAGHDPDLTHEWRRMAQERLSPRFDFGPEGITHHGEERECLKWNTKDFFGMIETAFLDLKEAGFDPTGFTSPRDFGSTREGELICAVSAIQDAHFGRKRSWYHLHHLPDQPDSRPRKVLSGSETFVVSIPSNVPDLFGKEVFSDLAVADEIVHLVHEVLKAGGWPVVLAHWKTLWNSGRENGLKVLDRLGRKVKERLEGQVYWANASHLTLETICTSG